MQNFTETDTERALRNAYSSIFITRDDSPEDRRTWQAASEREQAKAANRYHLAYGGTVPYWAA